MGITEMLDELKSKACRDEKLRVKNFMLRCAGALMAVARTHQCLKARMIFTNYSLQDWSKL